MGFKSSERNRFGKVESNHNHLLKQTQNTMGEDRQSVNPASRREALAALGAVSATTLAGCSQILDDEDDEEMENSGDQDDENDEEMENNGDQNGNQDDNSEEPAEEQLPDPNIDLDEISEIRPNQKTSLGFEVNREEGEVTSVYLEVQTDDEAVIHEEYTDFRGSNFEFEETFDPGRDSGEYDWKVRVEYPEGEVSEADNFTVLESLPELANLEEENKENYLDLIKKLEEYGMTERNLEDLFIEPDSSAWTLSMSRRKALETLTGDLGNELAPKLIQSGIQKGGYTNKEIDLINNLGEITEENINGPYSRIQQAEDYDLLNKVAEEGITSEALQNITDNAQNGVIRKRDPSPEEFNAGDDQIMTGVKMDLFGIPEDEVEDTIVPQWIVRHTEHSDVENGRQAVRDAALWYSENNESNTQIIPVFYESPEELEPLEGNQDIGDMMNDIDSQLDQFQRYPFIHELVYGGYSSIGEAGIWHDNSESNISYTISDLEQAGFDDGVVTETVQDRITQITLAETFENLNDTDEWTDKYERNRRKFEPPDDERRPSISNSAAENVGELDIFEEKHVLPQEMEMIRDHNAGMGEQYRQKWRQREFLSQFGKPIEEHDHVEQIGNGYVINLYENEELREIIL